jgi:hypothetical protein
VSWAVPAGTIRGRHRTASCASATRPSSGSRKGVAQIEGSWRWRISLATLSRLMTRTTLTGVDPSGERGVAERVQVRYRLIDGLPLWIGHPSGTVLEQLTVSRAHGGTVFIVQPEQWRAVLDVLPPAELPDARAYCRSLVGQTVFTITHRRPNRIPSCPMMRSKSPPTGRPAASGFLWRRRTQLSRC